MNVKQAYKKHIELIKRTKINYTLKSYKDYEVLTLTNKKNINRDYKKNVEGKKSLQSLQRARRNILQIFNDNITMNDVIFTLTYAENMQDYEQAYNDFRYFIDRLKYKYKFEYIAVQELQDRGAIHYHCIMFLYGESISLTENELWNIWGHAGYDYQGNKVGVDIDNVRPDNIDSLPYYFSKYLTDYKKGQVIQKNKRLYNVSRGIKKTTIQKLDYEQIKGIDLDNSIEIVKNGYVKYIINKELKK